MPLYKLLKAEPVSRLPLSRPRVRHPDDSIREAVQCMQEGRSGCLLVLGDKEELVGIFTERDFLKSVVGKGGSLEGRLGDVMTRSPTTLTVNDTVAGALELMQKGGYRHLPVLDESGMVKGVLSVKRIAHWLVEHFPTAVYTLPPDSNRASAVREGA